ncbi:hypothetical protein H6P81_007263 [Aristolochia fimbriata]|uniref:Aminotransferase-like plant mobile domain-containing protein n=1 Tax=Aristolochia fimbriata TaxID=158543 RepID=A0AAV7F102_ARIFI|nr:hypothetical protein H6P81_007263 [Aristolochia fimbriata]
MAVVPTDCYFDGKFVFEHARHYPYEMYIPVLGEGAHVEVGDGALEGASAERDERGGGAIVEYIPEERHVQFRVLKSGPTLYLVRYMDDQCPWRDRASQVTTHLCSSVDAHLRTYVDDAIHLQVVMVDATLLYDQASHRSKVIWQGEDLGCLECTEHFQTLRHWPLDARLMSYNEAAGFGALVKVKWLRLDKPLITSLVERWRTETNTFHLANGVMTISLEDVGVLLGLRFDGFAVTGLTRGDKLELARALLGIEIPPERL